MLSNYEAGQLLSASVRSATTYLALLTAPAVPADTGTTLTAKEVVYGGYQRVAVPTSTWPAPAEASFLTNIEPIALAKCTSGAATAMFWALCDAVTAGHVVHFGDTAPFVIDLADPEPSIGIGLLRLVFA